MFEYCAGRCRSSALVAGLIIAVSTSEWALSHHVDDKSPATPPMEFYAREAAELRRDFSDSAKALRGVIDTVKLWPAGMTLNACFYDGDRRLKAFFARVAKEWLPRTSLKIDFDENSGFRACSAHPYDDIRISFRQKGNWSYLGIDSIHPEIIDKGVSLNVETQGLPFDRLNLKWMREVTLHEIGHALGLQHEHQSPESLCDREFNWPRIISHGRRSWGWDEEKIRYNFESLVSSERFRTTPYDRASIMHYSLPAWMFRNGRKSRCYVAGPRNISRLDREAVRDAYPIQVSQQNDELQRRANAAGAVIGRLNLVPQQLGKAGERLASTLRYVKRDLTLQVPIGPAAGKTRSLLGALKPCAGESLEVAGAPGVDCGVAADGSSLTIVLKP